MSKLARKLIAIFAVLVLVISAFPMTASASPSSEYVKVTKHDSFNKNGSYWLSFTFENLAKQTGALNDEVLMIDANLYNSSGRVVDSWNTVWVYPEGKEKRDYGTNYTGMPSGTYTFRLKITAGVAEKSWTWEYNIKHTEAKPSASYKSYGTYYNNYGRMMHKVSITCKNMKGERLYCEIYNEDGHLVYDFGNNIKKIASNNETKWFAWSGTADINGTLVARPSGNYTYIITNSTGKTVVQKTVWLNIPQG